MKRADFVLAALATSGVATHTPVQVQKFFFLLDKKIPDRIDRPLFDFKPFDYGPFDCQVYCELEYLATAGLVEINQNGRGMKLFRLTPNGQEAGNKILKTLNEDIVAYVTELSKWVRSLSFAELVPAIYDEYPDMKANSVFRY